MAHVHPGEAYRSSNSTGRKPSTADTKGGKSRLPAINGAEPTLNGPLTGSPRGLPSFMQAGNDLGDPTRHRPPSAGTPHRFQRNALTTAPAKAKRPNGLLTRDLGRIPAPSSARGLLSKKNSVDSFANETLGSSVSHSPASFASVELSQPPTPSTRFHSIENTMSPAEDPPVPPPERLESAKITRRLEAALKSPQNVDDASPRSSSHPSPSVRAPGAPAPCTKGLPFEVVEAVQACECQDLKMMKTVGIGTFGVVKLCELKGYPFVLKIMSKSHVTAYKQKDNTFGEQRVLAYLNHPFIVKLYKCFNSQLCIYMMLEYIPGGELFSFLRRERQLSLEISQFYTAQMVLALQYLFSKEIVYRDIKPENLLIDGRGYLVMTDFGFAKQVPTAGKCFTMCGTPEYMAPEVILRQPGYSYPVDWWAVGVLLYEMLVGRSPFQNNDTKKVYRGVLRGKVDYEPVEDPTARDLIRRLLIRDPAKRGVYQGGEQQTQRHRFFRGMDWDRLYLQQTDSPWQPKVKGAFDCDQFEEYSLREETSVLKLLDDTSVEDQIMEGIGQKDGSDWDGFAGCFVNN